ncbi:hypothetical protein [Rubricoccus marinus]|uniref:Uncharacterized protein n=1 Tax=Rubricoccus marinus TaxID=716817 RepID=A0A259TYR0_9BACT|nr:hypothetical protein [Rubricoccus marinus]OZC02830.1 hypothetical protein BSZ36_07495 [Rubricoccus marinus]
MATSNPNTDSTDEPLADRANVGSDKTAGGPEPVTDTAPVVPTGSAEPAKQAVSGSASPAPGRVAMPTPGEYEMPDDYASDSPVEKVKQWAEAHPGLALLAASGVGLVVGRLLIAMSPDPEPPTLTERVEKRAKVLQKQAKGSYAEAKHTAGDAATASAAALAAAAVALKEAAEHVAERAGEAAEEGVDKAKDFADVMSDAVKVAVTGVVAKKADGWIKKFRD